MSKHYKFRLGLAVTATILATLDRPSSASAVDAPPANDNFANRTVLQGNAVIGKSTTLGATREAFEPTFDRSPAYTVWWTWTAPSTGMVNLDTGGSSLNPSLSVFNGASIDTLKAINSSVTDTAGNVVMSFPTVAGVTYQISVGSTNYQGPVELNIHITNPTLNAPNVVESEAATNDNFAQATVLSGTAVTGFGFNLQATREPFETPGSGDGTLWWAWTAPASGLLSVDTAGMPSGNILGAFTGSEISNLTVVGAAEMKFGFDSPASFVLNVTKGVTYHFSIGGDPGVGGPGRIRTEILNLKLAASNSAGPQATVAANSASFAAGSGTVNAFTINLASPATSDLQVAYTVKGSAVAGVDYTRLKGTIKIKAGKSSKALKINLTGNLGGANKKTIILTLNGSSGYTVDGSSPAKLKIVR